MSKHSTYKVVDNTTGDLYNILAIDGIEAVSQLAEKLSTNLCDIQLLPRNNNE